MNLTMTSHHISGTCEFGKFGGTGGSTIFNDKNQVPNGEVTGFTITENANYVMG